MINSNSIFDEIVPCDALKIAQYSTHQIKKGLELAKAITAIDAKTQTEKNLFYSRKVWVCIGTIFNYCPNMIMHISISPDGKVFAVQADEMAIDLWDTNKMVMIRTINANYPGVFEINTDSSITVCEQDSLTVRDIESDQILHNVKIDQDYEQRHINNSQRSKDTLLMYSDFFDECSVAISDGLNLIASYNSLDNSSAAIVYIWNIKTGVLVHQIRCRMTSDINNIFFARDAPILVICGDDISEIWNPVDGTFVNSFDFDFGFGTSLTSDGLAAFRYCQMYDLNTGKPVINFLDSDDFHLTNLDEFEDEFQFSSSSSFSQDSNTLVAGGFGGAIKVFKNILVNELLSSDIYNERIRDKIVCKLVILADEQYKKGAYLDSVESYTIAIEIQPDNIKAYNGRSTVRSAIGDYVGAIEDLNRVKNTY